MENNENLQNNNDYDNEIMERYKTVNLADEYFSRTGFTAKVFTVEEFKERFCFLIQSSRLPFIILDKKTNKEKITHNTNLSLMCCDNLCNSKFNSSVKKLFNDYLNFKTCCPKCKDKFIREMEEEEKHILDAETKYSKYADNALNSESWFDEKIQENMKVVLKEDGTYGLVPRTPEEIEIYKRTVKARIKDRLENPEKYQRESKRDRLARMREENNIYVSKSNRYNEMYNSVSPNVSDKGYKMSVTSNTYDSSSRDRTPNIMNTGTSLSDRYSGDSYNGEEIVFDDNYKLNNRKVSETVYDANIHKDEEWNNVVKESQDPFHRKFNVGINPYDDKYFDNAETGI